MACMFLRPSLNNPFTNSVF